MEFFIIDRNGQQAGPFSFDQLVQKGISPETLVWKQGMADWTPAWKVEDLRAVLEAIEANQSNQNAQKQEGVLQDFQQQGANQQQAHQQDYQKAQQEAYQQGFQQGAAMNSNFQQQPWSLHSSTPEHRYADLNLVEVGHLQRYVVVSLEIVLAYHLERQLLLLGNAGF